MTKLFIVVNVDWFFLSHRLPIALEAVSRGYDVTILAIEEENKGQEIRSHGLKFIPLPATRGGYNLFSEITLFRFLLKTYRTERPDIVHHVAIKPVLYGSLAARWAGIPKIVNAISGLGSAFIESEKFNLVHFLVRKLYKMALQSRHIKIIVQNKDDYQFISSFPGLRPDQVFLIRGSGVDLNTLPYSPPEKDHSLCVLMASRMLYDKGVKEFVDAAKKISKEYNGGVTFLLAGKMDLENSSGIPLDVLQAWNAEGIVQWIGHQEDMLTLYRKADIVVLPSYREGLPKTLIEAGAIGRPVVTTDVPGCREVVRPGENGLLVAKGDADDLAAAILELLKDEPKRLSMGLKAREIVENEFSIQKVIGQTFAIYEAR